MNELITQSNVTFGLGIIAIIFSVYNYFKNPQIKSDQVSIKMQEQIDSLRKEIGEVKTEHIKNIEGEIKELNKTINQLSVTVTRLSTIIDERIPKVNNS